MWLSPNTTSDAKKKIEEQLDKGQSDLHRIGSMYEANLFPNARYNFLIELNVVIGE